MEEWIVVHFRKRTWIKAWGQWSEEQEEKEDEGRGKWDNVSAATEFDAGHNGEVLYKAERVRESVSMR